MKPRRQHATFEPLHKFAQAIPDGVRGQLPCGGLPQRTLPSFDQTEALRCPLRGVGPLRHPRLDQVGAIHFVSIETLGDRA